MWKPFLIALIFLLGCICSDESQLPDNILVQDTKVDADELVPHTLPDYTLPIISERSTVDSCLSISDKTNRYYCISSVAQYEKNLSLCELIDDLRGRNPCYLGISDCGTDMGCLKSSLEAGISSKVLIEETIDELNIWEKAQITAGKIDEGYKVSFNIVDIKYLKDVQPMSKSALGGALPRCPGLERNIPSLSKKSASCKTDSIDQALLLIDEGLTNQNIESYSCSGPLIRSLKSLCDEPTRPPIDYPIMVKKPAVYIYPENETVVKVYVEVDGKIIRSDPVYSNGWTVTADKTGIIEPPIDYLFYEVQLDELTIPETGWLVKEDDRERFFEYVLGKMGFNKGEISDFNGFWISELEGMGDLEVRIMSQKFMEEHMRLISEPEADRYIRANFIFRRANGGSNISPPDIQPTERGGFSIMEWGGVILE